MKQKFNLIGKSAGVPSSVSTLSLRSRVLPSGISSSSVFLSKTLFSGVLLSGLIILAATLFPQCPADACFFKSRAKAATTIASRAGNPQTTERKTSAVEVELVLDHAKALYWKAEAQPPKAVLLCLHELGMHAGRFEDLGKRMSAQGVDVYATDLRGFGKWLSAPDGKKAKMSIDDSVADAKATMEALRKKYDKTPVFLLGEAMGGAIALKVAAKYPDLVQGTISAAPGGEHFNTVSNYLNIGSRVLTRPNKDANMAKSLISIATPRQDLQNDLLSDPHVRLDLNPKELMACQFFMYKTKGFARQIRNGPVLIVQGDKDGESKPEGSQKIYEKLATKDKTMLNVKDGDHYVFEDKKVNDEAMASTMKWIESHLSQPSNKG